ncbi:hypothetical protein [Siccirubricoccus phaeus]|uniref:hypothetical protein n=1 Tax=Siccirubricoccus phaeus TaxID=2595053 RepID=UPI0011F21A2F|nr:hypothetical protein [Siccirubricoccus phaeus]
MIIPDDPFALVAPPTPDFRVPGWQLAFADFKWFYVVGARHFLSRAGVTNNSDATEAAYQINIPTSWNYGEYNHGKLKWDEEFASNQVLRAIHTKRQGFAKACLSILAIKRAVEIHGRPDFIAANSDRPISYWMKIAPATFYIVDYTDTKSLKMNTEQIKEFLRSGYQESAKFLEDIAVGHGATFRTLNGMSAYLRDNKYIPTCDVLPKHNRTRNAKKPSPNEMIRHLFDVKTGVIA